MVVLYEVHFLAQHVVEGPLVAAVEGEATLVAKELRLHNQHTGQDGGDDVHRYISRRLPSSITRMQSASSCMSQMIR